MGLWRLTKRLIRGWFNHLRTHRAVYIGLALGVVGLSFLTVPNDEAWVKAIARDRSDWVLTLARLLSRGAISWALIVAGLLASFGLLLRRRRWLHVAWAVILAAALAGTVANAFRFSLGRPRPNSSRPDGFYGPTVKYRLHGFPSAHASTAAATAAALIAFEPWIGIPIGVAATGVIWSRMHRRRHHPTDVMVGAFLGVLFGVGLGRSARRLED